tara:strand:+ start:1326 stop:2423 length:1098 start_codon:yes stop_codon:yes gene_type:complete
MSEYDLIDGHDSSHNEEIVNKWLNQMILRQDNLNAPDALICNDGKPLFGHFNGIPKKLAIGAFDYRTVMDKPASGLSKYFHYKQFQFVSIFTKRYVIGVAIADIRYLSSSFCYIYDVQEDKLVEQTWLRPLHFGKGMSRSSYQGTAWIANQKIQFHIRQGEWQVEIKTANVTADLYLSGEDSSLPLSMCTPTGYSGWTYTQKHNALKLKGILIVNGRPVDLEHALAGYDFSAGYMRRETSWRWASISAEITGTTVGLNLAAGVNETGSCENVVWINGERHLLGPVHFHFQRDDINAIWRITSESGQIDLQFQPKNKRSEKLNLWLLKSNFRQFIGHFSGTVTDNTGQVHTLNNVLGLTEDHFARW